MKKFACVFSAILFLAGCSRSGHHPEPIAPQIARSPYDIRARGLRATNGDGLSRPRVFSKPQPRLTVGDSVHVSYLLDNVGTATIPENKYFISLFIDGNRLNPASKFPVSIDPGEVMYGGVSPQFNPPLVPKEAKLYEFKVVVGLSKNLGETNLDDNELIVYVDVEE